MREGFLRQLLGPFFLGICGALSLAAAEPPSPEAVTEKTQVLQQADALSSGSGKTLDWKRVDAAFRKLEERFPQDVEIRNSHASVLWEQGKTEEAQKLWRAAEKLDEKNSTTLYRLGSAAVASGDTRTAAHYLERACQAEPTNPQFHFDLANVLILFRRDLVDKEHPDPDVFAGQAMTHYAEACRLAPQSTDFARGYAETFYGVPNPNWEEALKAWQHLHDISPTPDFALANLATVHLKLGQKEEARACVAKMQDPSFALRRASLLRRIEVEGTRPAPAGK